MLLLITEKTRFRRKKKPGWMKRRCYLTASVWLGTGVKVAVWETIGLGVRVEVGQAVMVGPLSTGSNGTVAVKLGMRRGSAVELVWARVRLGWKRGMARVAPVFG
jgi:hypothetical protein